jgi:lysophospholipase
MKKFIIPAITSLLLGNSAFAISEGNYEETYQKKVVPLIKSMNEGFFNGKDGISIHYRTLLKKNDGSPRNCLVILPGREEALEKYAEVVYDLNQSLADKNLSFYLMDHRGQGTSGRMKKTLDMSYVEYFDDFVTDVETFLINQKVAENCDQKFLLAHSLGGGIAVGYLLKHPAFFDKVALSSPMLKIMTKPFGYKTARAIVSTATFLGLGDKFAAKQKGFDPDLTFEQNAFTTSPERFKMARSMFTVYGESKLGGVSNRFVLEVMKATNLMRTRLSELRPPMRVFIAGNELYVEPSEMVKMCDVAGDCQAIFLKNSKHEVLMDRDVNRDVVMKELVSFFHQ